MVCTIQNAPPTVSTRRGIKKLQSFKEQEVHSWDIYQKGASAAKLVEILALVVYLASLAMTLGNPDVFEEIDQTLILDFQELSQQPAS